MPKTMRAAFVKAPFQVDLRTASVPQVRPGCILVKVGACGICGADLQAARSEATDWSPFGHEVSGVVAEVGPGVDGVREGDDVVLESGSFCACGNGPRHFVNETMGFADYVLAPGSAAVPFVGLTYEQASIVEPMGVALDLVYTADIRPGNDVLVVGLGPIGLMAIALARRLGAGCIYGAHSRPGRRLDRGLDMGADQVFCVQDRPIAGYPYRGKRVAGPSHRDHVVDRVLVTAPPYVIPEALNVLNYGGILAFVGIEYGDRQAITIDANDFHFNKVQLRASYASPALYFPTCLQMLLDEWLDTDLVTSHMLPLHRLGEALLLLRDDSANTLKVIIVPSLW